jgi:hypothetical protein
MNPSCIRPEEFGSIEALSADDPARMHLAECPRCQARWKAYRAFLEDANSPARSEDEAAAEAALGSMVRTEFGLLEEKETAGRRPRFRRASWRGWLSSRARTRLLILTPSAALVAVAIVMLAANHQPLPGEPAFRGSESSAILRLESPQTLPDGSIRLSWSAAAGADSYRIRVLDTALDPALQITVPGETSTIIRPADLGDAVRSGAQYLWRVTALRDGEELGTSGVGTLRIP